MSPLAGSLTPSVKGLPSGDRPVGGAIGSRRGVIEALRREDTRGVAGEPPRAVCGTTRGLTRAEGVTGTSGAALCAGRGQRAGLGGGPLPCRRWGSASPSFRFASSHASSNAVLAWRPSEAVRVTTTCQTHCEAPCKPWRAKTGSYVRGAGFPLLPLALRGEQQAVCTSRALPELGAVPPCFLRAAGSPDGSHRQDAESSAQHCSSRKPGKRPLSIMAFSRNKESIKGVFFTEHP